MGYMFDVTVGCEWVSVAESRNRLRVVTVTVLVSNEMAEKGGKPISA